MLIELIIEFKWKGPGPPGRTCTPTTGYFHDKVGICNKNHPLSNYLLLKYCSSQCTLLPLPGPNHLQKLAPKCKFQTCFGFKL